MRYLNSLIILCVFFTSCAPWRGVVSTIQVKRDNNGDVPQDIAKKFIQYAEDDNYEAAAMLFTAESLKSREDYGGGFKEFCRKFKKNDEHRFSSATRDKGDSFCLTYSAKYKSKEVSRWLFFTMDNGVWKMTS